MLLLLPLPLPLLTLPVIIVAQAENNNTRRPVRNPEGRDRVQVRRRILASPPAPDITPVGISATVYARFCISAVQWLRRADEYQATFPPLLVRIT